MTLLDLIPGLKHTATTNGDEYAEPCPSCGDRDRFRAWPDQGTTGRFWCRGCSKRGDAIQFLRDREGLSFRDACDRLGVMLSLSWKPGHRSERATGTGTTWTPREATTPGDAWQDRAGAFLQTCQTTLAGPEGIEARTFLTGRGLHPGTIERAGLGLNIADTWESREIWDLAPEQKEDGKPRRV